MADPLSIETWRHMFQRHGQKIGYGLAAAFGIPLVVGFGLNQYTGGGRGAQPRTTVNNVIGTVNGQPLTEADYLAAAQQTRSAEPGTAFAQAQGRAMNQLVALSVEQQMAAKREAKPTDAEIDAILARERQAAGGKLTDSAWEDAVYQTHGMTLSDYRDYLAKQMAGLALLDWYKAHEQVSDSDVKKQNDEVKFNLILIPTQSPMSFGPKNKTLPDAEARAKASALLAQAKAGADVAALARANSGDFSAKQGGLIDWRPEYKLAPNTPPDAGAMGYGKEFDDAVHATATGQLTPVIKFGGFTKGYGFAKILERRNKPPKDFEPRKAAQALRDQRAQTKLVDDIRAQLKVAKVDITDPEKRAYYDFGKLEQMQYSQMMAQMGQSGGEAVSAADIAQLQTKVDADFVAMQKAHPEDATAALMVAQQLKKKRFGVGVSAQDSARVRDQLIALDETALKSTENRETRFELADMYREEKNVDKAASNYAMIGRLLDADPPYDLNSDQAALIARQRLAAAFESINKATEAAKQHEIIAKLQADIAVQQKKTASAPAAGKLPGSSLSALPASGATSKPSLPLSVRPGAPAASPGAH